MYQDISKDATIEYQRPVVTDFGDLAQMTQSNQCGNKTDVPMNTSAPFVLSGPHDFCVTKP